MRALCVTRNKPSVAPVGNLSALCMPQERMRQKLEKQKEELAEYEESRREEREREAAEIAAPPSKEGAWWTLID